MCYVECDPTPLRFKLTNALPIRFLLLLMTTNFADFFCCTRYSTIRARFSQQSPHLLVAQPQFFILFVILHTFLISN